MLALILYGGGIALSRFSIFLSGAVNISSQVSWSDNLELCWILNNLSQQSSGNTRLAYQSFVVA
jgi:hypothetical protein